MAIAGTARSVAMMSARANKDGRNESAIAAPYYSRRHMRSAVSWSELLPTDSLLSQYHQFRFPYIIVPLQWLH